MNTKKNIAVLGSGGFTGRHFIKYLQRDDIARRYDAWGLDLQSVPGADSRTCQVDVTDRNELIRVLERISPAIIVNLMGKLRGDDLSEFYRCNVQVSQTLMEYALTSKTPVSKILLIGSAAEYGFVRSNPVGEEYARNPVSPYGLSKVLQSEVAGYFYRKFNVPVVIARTFNLTGEGISNQLAIGAWRDKIANAGEKDTLTFGNLESYRDYMTVEQAVDIYWKLIEKAPAGQTYNVCSGQAVQMRSLLEDMIRASGKDITIETEPSLYKSDDLPIIFGDNTKLSSFLASLK